MARAGPPAAIRKSEPMGDSGPQARNRYLGRRLLPLLAAAIAAALFFALRLDRYVGQDALAGHRLWLQQEVAAHPLAAPALFILAYTLLVAISFPGAGFATIGGGYLFGTVEGAACAVIGATCGAVLIFLVARTSLAPLLKARAGPRLQRLEAGFRRNALNYLLFLRLVPLFPFWLVNLAPALLGMSLPAFVLGTFIGIIPASAIYAGIGAGLDAVFARGGQADLHAVASEPSVWAPLLGLGLLALLPLAARRWRRGRDAT
jgi:uncharacterized membrane protein YdjX (TVP38/TMEM64 family)